MTTVATNLPIAETVEPADQAALAARVREAHEAGTVIYSIGGGTSLDYGLTPTRTGIGLSLKALNRVVDYPSRDMTITVEAGMTMGQLAETLARERQWLPLDVPRRPRRRSAAWWLRPGAGRGASASARCATT